MYSVLNVKLLRQHCCFQLWNTQNLSSVQLLSSIKFTKPWKSYNRGNNTGKIHRTKDIKQDQQSLLTGFKPSARGQAMARTLNSPESMHSLLFHQQIAAIPKNSGNIKLKQKVQLTWYVAIKVWYHCIGRLHQYFQHTFLTSESLNC